MRAAADGAGFFFLPFFSPPAVLQSRREKCSGVYMAPAMTGSRATGACGEHTLHWDSERGWICSARLAPRVCTGQRRSWG
jgi:hypothetical protein